MNLLGASLSLKSIYTPLGEDLKNSTKKKEKKKRKSPGILEIISNEAENVLILEEICFSRR